MKNRHYKFKDAWNIRDIGGYETTEGKKTKEYKFVRGTGGQPFSDEEKEILYKDGIRVIIDLRTTHEICKHPHPLKDYKDIEYYNIDMIGSYGHMLNRGYPVLYELYYDLINGSQNQFCNVLKVILDHQDQGIYFNCTAGKDRTGLISMILLWIVGVQEKEIIDNYSESFENNKPMMAKGGPYSPETMIYFYSEPEYMVNAINLIKNQYGGIEKYLLYIGLTKEEIAKLRTIIEE